VEIGCFDRHDTSSRGHQTELPSIIQDHDEVAFTYLKNIDNLWRLGTKDWSTTAASGDRMMPPTRPPLFGVSNETV
jgi:hypothetical protein